MSDGLLIVTEALTFGGVETHLDGEVRCLSEQGVAVHLAAGEAFRSESVPAGVASSVHGLRFLPDPTIADVLETISALRKLIQDKSPRAVHVHGFVSVLPALIAAELEGLPGVVTLHGPGAFASVYGHYFDFLRDRIVLPSAARVLAVSPEVKCLYDAYVGAPNIKILPNAVEVDGPPEPAKDQSKAQVGTQVWLYVSRLDAAKSGGLLALLEHIAQLPAVRLDILGEGPALRAAQQRVSDLGLGSRVAFKGMLMPAASLMPDYAVVCGMGRVVLEALSQGRPACLVGYDGVKGFVTSSAFDVAAFANFSGRGMANLGVAELQASLTAAQDGIGGLARRVRKDYSERGVWADFWQDVSALESPEPGFLSAWQTMLATGCNAGLLDGGGSLYADPVARQTMRIAELQANVGERLMQAYLGTLLQASLDSRTADLLSAQHRLEESQYHLHEVQKQNGQLAQRIEALEASLRDAADEKRAAVDERDAATLAWRTSEAEAEHGRGRLMEISDWAARMDRGPIRYGLKKHGYRALRAGGRLLPLPQGVKSRLRPLLRAASRSAGTSVPSVGGLEPYGRSASASSLSRPDCQPVLGRRDVVMFAVIDWHFRFQRPQQLALALARAGYRVFYVSNEFIDSADVGYQLQPVAAQGRVVQVRLHVNGAPPIYYEAAAPRTAEMIRQGIARLFYEHCIASSVAIIHHPFWQDLAWSLPNTVRVYDCMDHHEGFGGASDSVVQAEERLLAQSDVVIVT